jgi:hypothetical protein
MWNMTTNRSTIPAIVWWDWGKLRKSSVPSEWDSDRVRQSRLHTLADCTADTQHPKEGVELMGPSWISHNSCDLIDKRMKRSYLSSCKRYSHSMPLFNPSSWLSIGSRDSVVGSAIGYGLDGWGVGVRVPVGWRIVSSPRSPDWLWGSPIHISNRYRRLFPRG